MNAMTEPQLRRWSSYASFTVAVLLVIAKATAWFVTDSLSLLASLVDAVVDVTAALVTVLGVHYAARPADAMHRFGHGNAESLAALIQALLLAGKRSDLRRAFFRAPPGAALARARGRAPGACASARLGHALQQRYRFAL